MAIQQTLSIIKPDAVEKNRIGAITALIEKAGLTIKAMRMTHLSKAQAEGFYAEHKGKKFFEELVEFMTRSPVVLMCLEGEDAVAKYRATMGATNPAEAEEGTIRKAYGSNIGENACHGSDSPGSAEREVSYFFPELAAR